MFIQGGSPAARQIESFTGIQLQIEQLFGPRAGVKANIFVALGPQHPAFPFSRAVTEFAGHEWPGKAATDIDASHIGRRRNSR